MNKLKNKIDEIKSNVFILFSGHNDRAIITLCRFFEKNCIQFVIVSSGKNDLIKNTTWKDKIIFSRIDRTVDIELFQDTYDVTKTIFNADIRTIYCPTTEFMNKFALKERYKIEKIGWNLNLPDEEIYNSLTSKYKSIEITERLIKVSAPRELAWENLKPPCVIKPRNNIVNNNVYYPRLCLTQNELNDALKCCDNQEWFAQEWVDGQSYYLCGYISRSGNYKYFWQENLIQQPSGKSIVFARSVQNPGVLLDSFWDGLIKFGYHGPIMMELIKDSRGTFKYIEINPRFWGPLQLTLDACDDILKLFLSDTGTLIESTGRCELYSRTYWYSWQKGAGQKKCREYPALIDIKKNYDYKKLIQIYDVYFKEDTMKLHEENNFDQKQE